MPPIPLDPDLLSRIPLAASTILDVGCGDGRLAEAYRLMNPKALVLGLEADAAAAAQAERHLAQVAVADVESEPMPFDVPGGIDCIIYSGILETLRDPWRLLRRHADALSPQGMMLIRVANFEHWRVAARLLRGVDGDTTASAPGGLAGSPVAGSLLAGPPLADLASDRPARWLDPKALRDTLTACGLTLCDVVPCDAESDPQAARRFAATIKPALNALDVDAASYVQRASPTHFLWRVRKTPGQPVIVAGNMLAPVGGVSHVRVMHPLHAIGTDPLLKVGVTDQVTISHANNDTPRIFVLHRPALTNQRGHEILRGLMDGGYVVVTEFDDHPDHFEMMRMGGEISFRGVHAIQTSTPALASILRRYNPEVAVFPNAVPVLQPVRNFADDGGMTLFFGALNREACWRSLMPAINAVAARAGKRLRFQVIHDHQFFEALETPHKTFTPTCDYDTYLQVLGASEISFMPLSDTPFNRAKSDLKFIEAGACRVASLASTVVYGDSIEHGRTGSLFRDATQLYSELLRLVTHSEVAKDLGDNARAYVTAERMLAYQVAPRITWYRSLWRRRAMLSSALRARMGAERQTAA